MKIAFRVDDEPLRMERCVALAGALKETDENNIIIFLSSCSPTTSNLIQSYDFTHVDMTENVLSSWDLEGTLEQLEKLSIDMIVLDKESDPDYLATLQKKVFLASFYDKPQKYPVHVLINPNLNAHLIEYSSEAELLLGTDFLSLPVEFDRYADSKREIPALIHHILVYFPVRDVKGLTLLAVKALRSLSDHFSVTVAVGHGFEKGEQLASEVGLDPRFIILEESDMAKRLASADLVISEPSFIPKITTLCAPTILLFSGENSIADYTGKNGLMLPIGMPSVTELSIAIRKLGDKSIRERMSLRMAELVDGLGRYRLAEELLVLYREKKLI